ncbi:secondary thiamine-phosphate synthase enzyme YjbQ [Magnetovibrio sp.]|uniref:secondary thiamine-phosphate synthase enzyme YjbQ n=1 Tax=Magnetovibrio sp. TaxID=2024836 RepID=UPI002F95D307
MRQDHTTLNIHTNRQGLFELTKQIKAWVLGTGINTGMLTVFCRHTSASLMIQENADPDVQYDIETFFKQLVREDPSLYTHTNEGPDDMPGHIRSVLTDVSLSIPVIGGAPVLGTWQGVFLYEHRARNHDRQVVLHLMGD